MKRREFITLLGSMAATAPGSWPLAARPQSSSVRPLIGALSPTVAHLQRAD